MNLAYRIVSVLALWATFAQAQLCVTFFPPKVIGQKAVVQLKMKNNLADKIESARAACFLLDEQGQMIGQSTKWVIGRSGLESKGQTTFNFVITSRQPFTTTNLTAKVTFNRVVLVSDPVQDLAHEVVIRS
ncbi:MAG TPA: hypothetical protein VNU95_15360, partial [Candidatus Acidoferrales bacterium]|nr:hypothetical protein [Candidatus Acidoferrales bacterium]